MYWPSAAATGGPGPLRLAGEIERDCADLSLGMVDVAALAVCEHLGETEVATVDRR